MSFLVKDFDDEAGPTPVLDGGTVNVQTLR